VLEDHLRPCVGTVRARVLRSGERTAPSQPVPAAGVAPGGPAFGRRTVPVPRPSPHSRRLLIDQGVHPKVIQGRLGHESIRTTLDTYGHRFPGLDEAAAGALDSAYNAVGGTRLMAAGS
jgi:hypothetical protein